MTTPEKATPQWDGADAENKERTADFTDAGAQRKRYEHARALLALNGGHVVHELADGSYLVCWKYLSRECRDLGELEAHVRRIGGAK